MVSSNVEQAGAKEVPSKKTDKKVHVSVCLTAKGGETKLSQSTTIVSKFTR